MLNLLLGKISPKVTDDNGDSPVVVCLDSEPLTALFEKVERCGGYATIFSLADSGEVRILSVLPRHSSLTENPTSLAHDSISGDASIGIFIDYVVSQGENGVETPSYLPAGKIKSFGQAELVTC
ncbi:hypothetical protein JOD55_001027 [Arcanobacterium pluranimalium]|uniref:hypothetical protein n=1 Tax=Arcanobacterium pluranimalium TaxID=108028 RepID=UPI00195D8762|nr:hypothetical protein [Arcanobacterium pluranimalium]MBM7825200.1 hypothetical protein [Arcanobacterium pluranimalium]